MFVKVNRINDNGNVKVAYVDTSKIVFVTETEPHVETETVEMPVNEDGTETVPVTKIVGETPRYLIAFDNGKHPMFLDKENFDLIVANLPTK